jgi:hypothetical protein
MNWDNFPKGSLNPEYDSLSFGLTGRDLSAAMYLDGDITLLEYRQGIDNNSIIFETQALNEFDMGDLRSALVDVIQVAAGAGLIGGTGGMGGDTLSDALAAIDASSQAVDAVTSAIEGAGEIANIVDGIMKVKLESGMNGIYAAVKQILTAAARGFDFAKKGLEAAKEQLDKFIETLKNGFLKLISSAIRGVEKWVSTIIPDDAGVVGIAIRETVEYMIEKAAENVYDLLKGAIGKVPDVARDLIFNSRKLGRFLHTIVNSVIDFIADTLKERKDKGLLGKAIDVAKFATNPFLSIATSDAVLLRVRNYLIKSVKPKIPMAVKAARFVFTLFFGVTAAFQIVMREEFLSDDMKRTVAMSPEDAPTVAMRPDELPTVAMPRVANENINKWMEYDPTAEKPQQVIPVKKMIVIKGDEKWGVRAAIKNVSEGRRSRSAGEPIQVTWILAENKFLITDGYHRLVEGMIKGKEEFLCEVDWSGCSLDWKVPRADNRFIMEALKKLS